jgi:hypothetical protein
MEHRHKLHKEKDDMARKKLNWNLVDHAGKGLISTVETTQSVPKPDKSGKITGNLTLVGRIVNLPAFQAQMEKVVNDGKEDNEKVTLSHAYLLAKFVNDALVTNFKQYLRIKADPTKAAIRAIERLRKQFPNMPDEQLSAIGAMLVQSITPDSVPDDETE